METIQLKKIQRLFVIGHLKVALLLRSLVVPESVISIGESAFDGCTSLSSLVIPNRVVSIKGNLFCGWYGDLICLSPYFIYENNVLFDKDKSTIISFRDQATTSYVIQAGVTSIGDCAFEGCESFEQSCYS